MDDEAFIAKALASFTPQELSCAFALQIHVTFAHNRIALLAAHIFQISDDHETNNYEQKP